MAPELITFQRVSWTNLLSCLAISQNSFFLMSILQLFIHAFQKKILGSRKTKAKQLNVFFNITTGTGIMNKIKLSRTVERLSWIQKDMLEFYFSRSSSSFHSQIHSVKYG